MWVDELKVIGAKHQDDKRERRMHFDLLRQAQQTIATGQKRVFENRPAAIQTVL